MTEPRSAPERQGDRDVARARTLARWLDDRFLDPILGLVLPGAGDLMTSGAGLYVLGLAVRKRLPAVVIARMLLNLALDTAIGAIPVVGDAFDLFFRAHSRNLALLEARHEDRRATASDWLFVVGAGCLLLLALALPVVLLVLLLRALF